MMTGYPRWYGDKSDTIVFVARKESGMCRGTKGTLVVVDTPVRKLADSRATMSGGPGRR